MIQRFLAFYSTAYCIVAEGKPTPLLSKLCILYYTVTLAVGSFDMVLREAR